MREPSCVGPRKEKDRKKNRISEGRVKLLYHQSSAGTVAIGSTQVSSPRRGTDFFGAIIMPYYRNGVLNEDGDGVYSVEASKNEYLVKCSVVIDEESLKTLYGELWPDLTTLVAFLNENRRGDLKVCNRRASTIIVRDRARLKGKRGCIAFVNDVKYNSRNQDGCCLKNSALNWTRMALHSLNFLTYFVILLYFVYCINGSSHYIKNVDKAMFRHRRSYELRRKGKESVVDSNSVKSMSNGSKPGVFATENCTVVVAQIGGTATLPCVVRKFNNGVVKEKPAAMQHANTSSSSSYSLVKCSILFIVLIPVLPTT
ncbi:hypothetical protein Zmor_020670 [Zophobas morio]|uniref:Uncharacterized protein n=1 Tax=Zophobas morio TaxID=2755281 RepID=A0AA38I473_9CUCU|nr:hypothetical protein Zmor_020670 [Zophobas morio]